MSEEETANKANERRPADQIVAADYIDHNAVTSKTGPAGVREEVSLFRNAFPDLLFAIEDVITEDDKVVTRISATGTHKGDLPGIPATGRRGAITGIIHHSLRERQGCRGVGALRLPWSVSSTRRNSREGRDRNQLTAPRSLLRPPSASSPDRLS